MIAVLALCAAWSAPIGDPLVPQTSWTRRIMRFHSEFVLGQNWSEVETLRPAVQRVKMFRKTPPYFHAPLHGFRHGGSCAEQALQQAPSMRFIMGTFQCDERYREHAYRDILSELDLHDDGLAVDVGCGTGDSLLALRDNVANPTIGFDLSRAMVKLARLRTGMKAYTSDAACLPLQTGDASIVTCFAMLHEMPRAHARKVLRELVRVVRRDGHIVIWDQNPHTIGRLQHELSEVPIEPYLLSYRRLKIKEDLEALGCTVDDESTRFMKHWIAKKLVD